MIDMENDFDNFTDAASVSSIESEYDDSVINVGGIVYDMSSTNVTSDGETLNGHMSHDIYPYYNMACDCIGHSLIGRCVENTVSDLEESNWCSTNIYRFLEELTHLEELRLGNDNDHIISCDYYYVDATEQLNSIDAIMERLENENTTVLLYIAGNEQFSQNDNVHANGNHSDTVDEDYDIHTPPLAYPD